MLDELLRYDVPLVEHGSTGPGAIAALPDEPHLEAWDRYAEQARQHGAIAALSRRFAQLLFPVRAGISSEEFYRAATRRGIWPRDVPEATGLALKKPEAVRLVIHPALVGRIPLLIAPDRCDFESLVRALAARNEPVAIPASMGACIVTGFNNWDRVHRHRQEWESAHPLEPWTEEFERLKARPSLYEDRFILLSTGLYSGVPAEESGFPEPEWRDLSLAIRREHECTHYFTFRVAGRMRNNLLDEVIADYAGLVRAFGRFREDLALRFFGLDRYPDYREGSRLENYRGQPPLSDGALAIARALVHGAIRNLARHDAEIPGSQRDGAAVAATVLALAARTLGEIASPGFAIPAAELATVAPKRTAPRS